MPGQRSAKGVGAGHNVREVGSAHAQQVPVATGELAQQGGLPRDLSRPCSSARGSAEGQLSKPGKLVRNSRVPH